MSKFYEALEQAERDRTVRAETAAAVASDVLLAPPELATPRNAPPVIRGPIDNHLVSLLQPSSIEAEQYRTLRHLIEQVHRTAGPLVLGVSSPAAHDGKTVTAINLAGALAQAPGAQVLLIDMDLRKPAVARYLALEGVPHGVVEALLNPDVTLEQIVHDCAPFNLSAVISRQPVTGTYELLKSPRCGDLISAARERYDYIVLDLPPLIPIPDCRIVEKCVDGFVVVVTAHKTPRKLLEESLAAVDPAKVVGLVFNGDDGPLANYGYGYGPVPEETSRWRGMVSRGRQHLGRRLKAATTRSSKRRSTRPAR